MLRDHIENKQNDHIENKQRDCATNMSHDKLVNDENKYSEYRKILGELGIEKPENEPFTDHELRQIFMHMQEGLCTI